MAVFQVSSRSLQSPAPPRKQSRRLPPQLVAAVRVMATMLAGGLIFTLLTFIGHDTIFLLLPIIVSLTMAQFQNYNPYAFLNSTPLYLLLTAGLTLVYYGGITGAQLLIHQNPNQPHILIITVTLAWAIMLEPLRRYVQRLIERHFNYRDREAVKAIEAFTATLREEIDLDQLQERFLSVIERTLRPYFIILWVQTNDEQQEPGDATREISIADDDPFIAWALNHPGTLEVDRLHLDSPTLQDMKDQGAEVLLPLTSQGELLGLLILGPPLKGTAYSREARNTLKTLAPQVAPALRVAQMVREQKMQMKKSERIEHELRTAQAIQRTFLPKDVSAPAGWHLASYYQPAYEVGGDFYDFLSLGDGRLGIIVGDVAGKGIPAALVMAATRTMLRTAAQAQASPGKVFAYVNDLLYPDISAGMFVTCFYGLLDPKNGQLRYANAGHELPYRWHNGSLSELWATGMPLGMLPGNCYDEHETTLGPGDGLFLYSDGLVEAHNATREMFGIPRLKATLEERDAGTPLIEFLLNELKSFTGEEGEQEDDVTLITLQRLVSSP